MLKKLRHLLFFLPWIVCAPATVYGDYLTPETWAATSNTFSDGRLKYRQFNIPLAPGVNDSAAASKYLLIDCGENLRDTVVKLPDTLVTIYDSGIAGNFVQYKGMVADNWDYAKLSRGDFAICSLIEKLGDPIDNIEGGDAQEFAGVIGSQGNA